MGDFRIPGQTFAIAAKVSLTAYGPTAVGPERNARNDGLHVGSYSPSATILAAQAGEVKSTGKMAA
jgi:hypothetical protein